MTRYPKAGEGQRWTIRELLAIPETWKGDTLSDGGGLSGEVRISKEGKASVRFKYAYRSQGKVCWHQCGTWPANDLAEIRRNRDIAKQQVAEGLNPTAVKESEKLEKQRLIAQSLAQAEQERSERYTVNDLFETWLKQGVNRADGNKELARNYTEYIKPSLGALELRGLTEAHIRELLQPVVAAGTVRKAQVMLQCIKQSLKWGEKRKPWRALLLEGNPADLVSEDSITPPDHRDERSRVLSAEEIFELSQLLQHGTQSYESAKEGEKLNHPRPPKAGNADCYLDCAWHSMPNWGALDDSLGGCQFRGQHLVDSCGEREGTEKKETSSTCPPFALCSQTVPATLSAHRTHRVVFSCFEQFCSESAWTCLHQVLFKTNW